MSIIVLIFLVFVLFILYQLGAIFLNIREIRRMQRIRYRQVTQQSFGNTRQQLMRLLGENEIKSDSTTFLHFYLMNTYIMRNPDSYSEIARLLREFLLEDAHDTKEKTVLESLNAEKAEWSPRIEEMVGRNADALRDLMIYHSPFLRTIYPFAKWIHRSLMALISTEFGLFNKGLNLVSSKDPSAQVIRDATSQLQRLAEPA